MSSTDMSKKSKVETEVNNEEKTLDHPESEIERLQSEVKRLEQELAEEKDTYLRKVADMDNYRKRLLREKEAAILFANEKLINDLIPILDDFERAIEAAMPQADVESYAEGVKLIQAQLAGMLDKNWGLKVMENPIGKEFSPHEMEACMLEEGEQYEHDTVLAELQKGYYLHDRVLRTAKVKVGKPV